MSIRTTNNLRIGISYDRPEEYPEVVGPVDCFAEFEPESTIVAMEAAIRQIGALPVRVGGPRTLLLNRPDVDVIWNISEGYGSKNRESWVPLICKYYQIPCLGSDGDTLNLSLDKSSSKLVAQSLGIPTSPWIIAQYHPDFNYDSLEKAVHEIQQEINRSANIHQPQKNGRINLKKWPLFVKPRYEGTGKGITPSSIVHNENELIAEISRQFQLYKQDLLVEHFLNGAEFTVSLTGDPLDCHPVLERGLDAQSRIGMHVIESIHTRDRELKRSKSADSDELEYSLSHSLSDDLEYSIHDWSKKICHEMKILDFVRLDYKMNEQGEPFFLEVNPLPTFAIDNNFAILAELQGISYVAFLGDILKSAVCRVGFQV